MSFTVNVWPSDYRIPSHKDKGLNHVAYNLYKLHDYVKKKKSIFCAVLSVTLTALTTSACLQFLN